MTATPTPKVGPDLRVRVGRPAGEGEHRLLPAWARLPRQPLLRHLVLAVLGGAVLFAITELVSSYSDYQLARIGVEVIALAGLSVLVGTSGQISLGNGAFVAIGAYTVALLLVHTKLPVAVALLAATAAGAVGGLVIGIPASRLRGPYLAGMTLALATGLPALVIQYKSLFGGDQGLSFNPLTPSGSLDPQRYAAWVVLGCAVVVMVLLGNLLRSRFGRAMRAVRDDEVAAALSGISVARTQVLAFSVSAACAGLAGGLLGLVLGTVSPGDFTVLLSIDLLAAMVLGGTGTLFGMWWGAVLLVYVPQWSSSLSEHVGLASSQAANLSLLFYGAVLVVVMLAFPAGIQGGVLALWRLVRRLLGAGRAPIEMSPAQAGDATAGETGGGEHGREP